MLAAQEKTIAQHAQALEELSKKMRGFFGQSRISRLHLLTAWVAALMGSPQKGPPLVPPPCLFGGNIAIKYDMPAIYFRADRGYMDFNPYTPRVMTLTIAIADAVRPSRERAHRRGHHSRLRLTLACQTRCRFRLSALENESVPNSRP